MRIRTYVYIYVCVHGYAMYVPYPIYVAITYVSVHLCDVCIYVCKCIMYVRNVRRCACIYIYIYTCMYVVYALMRECVYIMYVWMSGCMCVVIYVCIHVCMLCTCVCTFVCTHVCIHA